MFGVHRYFIECTGTRDAKQLVAVVAFNLGLEGHGRNDVIRHLTSIATESTPVLLVLDALDRAWKPHENRNDVEDFLSLLADLPYLTLVVTVRGGQRPRQVKWTLPFLPALQPLPPLLQDTQNHPGTITHMAFLASFEGCSSLVARWAQDGAALPLDKAERTPRPKAFFTENIFLSEEPEEMYSPTVAAESDFSLLDPGARVQESMPTIDFLASFEGCSSVAARWAQEGAAPLPDRAERAPRLEVPRHILSVLVPRHILVSVLTAHRSDDSATAVFMLPASPKIFNGRNEEVQHTRTITLSQPARIAICGPEGMGKLAVGLAASHSPEISKVFGVHSYNVECDGTRDAKQLVAVIAFHLGLDGHGRKHFCFTIPVTVRGGKCPRQVKFSPALQTFLLSAVRTTFLDISDVAPDELDLESPRDRSEQPTHMAVLMSFEACLSLV
ncbi:hypothetical protein MSAN_00241700 [Mycena sanguinolenta]|uniref:ATPase AAA-type core domain-containing protein n=1 Tax=Mycena sanguinolenta TaxID=230812 RepID=A0A8H6ZIT9_9AGAR|nr:hypothetical protein MSAN_00241700 [Mycena sanguinolenta]